jgi:oxaloacetate decarboxylase beta subunit
MKFLDTAIEQLAAFFDYTAFANFTGGAAVMLLVGVLLIVLSIKKEWAPLLLIPIGFGMLLGNIPFITGFQIGINEEGSILHILSAGVRDGWYPALIFLGIGAMTDFSPLISNPKLMLIGIATQFGIFGAYIMALQLGFVETEAGAIAIIGAGDGPTSIFLASRLAPELLSVIAISAYAYMAFVKILQPPFMRLLTTKNERVIRMKPPRQVSRREKIIFSLVGLLLTCCIVPAALPLLGMLFFGNLLKESGVTKRLATTISGAVIDVVTILVGLTVGVLTQASTFLTPKSIHIFILGAAAFVIATIAGVCFVKLMNLFLKNKINPLIGSAGVAALPDSAHVSQAIGQQYDKTNSLLMYAMGPNVAGIIGSAVAAGILLTFLY